jgi:hypothetical protein
MNTKSIEIRKIDKNENEIYRNKKMKMKTKSIEIRKNKENENEIYRNKKKK